MSTLPSNEHALRDRLVTMHERIVRHGWIDAEVIIEAIEALRSMSTVEPKPASNLLSVPSILRGIVRDGSAWASAGIVGEAANILDDTDALLGRLAECFGDDETEFADIKLMRDRIAAADTRSRRDATDESAKAHAHETPAVAALNAIRAKLAEYLERLLQGRALPNRWVGEINEIVSAALAEPPAQKANADEMSAARDAANVALTCDGACRYDAAGLFYRDPKCSTHGTPSKSENV